MWILTIRGGGGHQSGTTVPVKQVKQNHSGGVVDLQGRGGTIHYLGYSRVSRVRTRSTDPSASVR